MKRMGIAAALLVFAFCVCLWGLGEVRQETAALRLQVEQLRTQTEQENYPAAAQTAARLQEEWEHTAPRLCLWMNHTALGDSQRMITLLPELCREKNKQELLLACIRLRDQLEHLVRSEELRLENIF